MSNKQLRFDNILTEVNSVCVCKCPCICTLVLQTDNALEIVDYLIVYGGKNMQIKRSLS